MHVCSGLSVLGRDYYGVFPLKGKLLNVREATPKQLTENEEIIHIKQILGLKQGVEVPCNRVVPGMVLTNVSLLLFLRQYTDAKSLRYGSILLMTDQDHDGSHIKGLMVNLFNYFWPSLLKIAGFMTEFITPIVKCSKGSRSLCFYNMVEYEKWKRETNSGKGWAIKYYKGLGTSTAKEGREYFSELDDHKVQNSEMLASYSNGRAYYLLTVCIRCCRSTLCTTALLATIASIWLLHANLRIKGKLGSRHLSPALTWITRRMS